MLTHACRQVQTRTPDATDLRIVRAAVRAMALCARTSRMPSDQLHRILRDCLALSGLSSAGRDELVAFGADTYFGYTAGSPRPTGEP